MNQPEHRPVAGALRDRADALARDVLDRLPEHAAGRPADPCPGDPVQVGGDRRHWVGCGEDRVELLGLLGGERARDRVELVEQLERQRPQLGAHGLLRGAAARRRLPTGAEPAALHGLDVLPFLSRLSQLVADQVLRLDPADPQTATPDSSSMRLAPGLEALAVTGEDLASHLGHRAAGLLEVEPARRPDLLDELRRHRRPERAREGAAHRRNRVGVAAVVHTAEHRLGVVAVRREQEAERDRHLLDRVDPARGAGVGRRLWRTPRRPSRTARSPP